MVFAELILAMIPRLEVLHDGDEEGIFANWRETKAKLIRYGHSPGNLAAEYIRQDNPYGIEMPGHNWFFKKILPYLQELESHK